MGTNYYWIQEPCEKCGRGDERLHIGKSSVGWAFHLRLHPELGVENLVDWVRRFARQDSKILDEYGREMTLEEMLGCIYRNRDRAERVIHSPHFLRMNNAEIDARGFLRQHGYDESFAYDMSATEFH